MKDIESRLDDELGATAELIPAGLATFRTSIDPFSPKTLLTSLVDAVRYPADELRVFYQEPASRNPRGARAG